ncbi:MAG TPA: alpha/beta hydrolase [Nocardiopsis listeri]|uniref:alpha/beta hydrolase family protein n=1 Tax=Nocardiopsis listeri TaxID=53440 RepID=UPI001D4B1E90|nr:alpha/beta hydrolase [Nocardiopsis listeri]HJE57857.1 alpha/beta hydrolase [Nocardiopsis listeri]
MPARTPVVSGRPRRRGRSTAVVAALTLLVSACGPTEEEGPEPPGVSGTERELSFEGGGFTVDGTFTSPGESGSENAVPGALIISGSGPTDRDGNSAGRPEADTNLNLSRVLSEAGVASLRYDKLGSGDPATFDDEVKDALEEPVDPGVFDAQMAAAYAELIEQPEVDPERTIVVGHSEGALYALRAHEVLDGAEPALVLAAPPGTRMLDVIDRQLSEQVRTAEAQGSLSEAEAVRMLSHTRTARAAMRNGRDLPEGDTTGLFAPENQDFLAWIDAFDPPELAAGLPERTPVLVLWGDEDSQITRDEVDRLMEGLEGAERVDLAGVDHVLREYDDFPGAAVLDADRPFSPGVAPAVTEFVEGLW